VGIVFFSIFPEFPCNTLSEEEVPEFPETLGSSNFLDACLFGVPVGTFVSNLINDHCGGDSKHASNGNASGCRGK
jgi:hypothetical protein